MLLLKGDNPVSAWESSCFLSFFKHNFVFCILYREWWASSGGEQGSDIKKGQVFIPFTFEFAKEYISDQQPK